MIVRTIAESVMKDAGTLGWTEVGNREAVLIGAVPRGSPRPARSRSGHERMVYKLALHLLGRSRRGPRTPSRRSFQRLPHHSELPRPSALKTWIYRIVINQARNRRAGGGGGTVPTMVSLDRHVAAHGDLRPGDHTAPIVAYPARSWPKASGGALTACRSINAR